MNSILFFVPKFQVFKSLTKISVYDILTNNFELNLSKKLKPEYQVPIKQFLEEINFYYEITDQKKPVDRFNKWFHHFTFVIQVFNLVRCLIYIFWNEENHLIRLYGGDLVEYFGLNTTFFAIPQAGVSLYAIAIFCLFQYSSVKYLNWLTIFNPIQGKQSFISNKIFIKKSAKNFTRFSLILIIFCTLVFYLTPFLSLFNFLFFPFLSLTLNQFLLYALPWAIIDSNWVHLVCFYIFSSLIVLIATYYYELRLNQLNLHVNSYLKRKQFNRINEQVRKLLIEYAEIITEMNQLNKFISKLVFYMLLFCSSTMVFLIFNMIYVKIQWLMYILYICFVGNVSAIIILTMLSTIRIASKFQANKGDLIKLCDVKNLQTKNKIKVSFKMTNQLI